MAYIIFWLRVYGCLPKRIDLRNLAYVQKPLKICFQPRKWITPSQPVYNPFVNKKFKVTWWKVTFSQFWNILVIIQFSIRIRRRSPSIPSQSIIVIIQSVWGGSPGLPIQLIFVVIQFSIRMKNQPKDTQTVNLRYNTVFHLYEEAALA